jgi:hypothetical protein|tara:strand:+ start:33 stop:785 length:753 start_codon:yes stop_codon:yes gene_type:complete
MSSDSGDALHIPIEIKTEDLAEIRELLNQLDNAQGDIRSITPGRGRNGDTSSRSAFARTDDEAGGIFGGMGGEALPMKGRDRTSKSPFQRENEFSKLKNQVQDQEKRIGVGQQAQQGLNMITQGADYARILGPNANQLPQTIMEGFGKIAGSAVVPLAILTTIAGMISQGLAMAFAPGGIWDVRFKRVLKNEIASTMSRTEKAQIAQGLKIIRMTSYAGYRGVASSVSGEGAKSGIPVYDINLELGAKGQ